MTIIKWKWVIIKVFILVIFTLSRLRRRTECVGLAVLGVAEAEEVDETPGEAGTLSVTSWKYTVISA